MKKVAKGKMIRPLGPMRPSAIGAATMAIARSERI